MNPFCQQISNFPTAKYQERQTKNKEMLPKRMKKIKKSNIVLNWLNKEVHIVKGRGADNLGKVVNMGNGFLIVVLKNGFVLNKRRSELELVENIVLSEQEKEFALILLQL